MAEDLDNREDEQQEPADDFEEVVSLDDAAQEQPEDEQEDPPQEEQQDQLEEEQAQEQEQEQGDTPPWFRPFADRVDELGADLSELRQRVEDGAEPFAPEGPPDVPTIEELDEMFAPTLEGIDPEGGYPTLAGGEGVAVMDDGEGNQAIVGDPLVGDPEQAENEDRDLPEDSCVVQITAEEDGGGKYTGVILYGGNSSDPAVDTSMPEGLTEDSVNTVLVINMAEDGSSNHALAADGSVYATGEVRGITDEDPPRRIVYIELTTANSIKWAKANYNWTNAAGDGSYYPANIYPRQDCTGDADETGVNVYLPRSAGPGGTLDPNVVANQIYPCIYDSLQERWICIGQYLDGVIGKSVEIWTGDPADLSTDRPGWSLLSGIEGRFPVGYKSSDAAYDCIGDTGGYTCHGTTENNHTDHNEEHTHSQTVTDHGCLGFTGDGAQKPVIMSVSAIGSAVWSDSNHGVHTDTDNRPPFYAVAFIQRIDNSV